MKRFRFSLESVLRWRRNRLEQEQLRLQGLLAERATIQQRIRDCESQRRQAEQTVLRAALIQPQELAALEAYRRWLRQQRARLEQAASDCEARIAAQREVVLEARRELRLIEKLKERRLTEWEAEAARELEGLAAETYLAQWGRRQ